MARDFQRTKVYTWEFMQFPKMKSGGLSLDQCKALAATMYGSHVTVRDGRGRRRACAFPSLRHATIALPVWARTPEIVAHEVAHLVAARRKDATSAHGGIFMGEYLTLLASHCGQDREALAHSAREFGLRVILPD